MTHPNGAPHSSSTPEVELPLPVPVPAAVRYGGVAMQRQVNEYGLVDNLSPRVHFLRSDAQPQMSDEDHNPAIGYHGTD